MAHHAIFRTLLISALLGLLASCGTGDVAWYSENTGAVSARLVFPAAAVLPGEDASAPLALPDLSASVNTIRITAHPAAGDPVSVDFPYADRTGTLGGIPTGPNCRVVLEGIADGAVRYRNSVAPVLIEKGVTTEAGDVPMIRVKSGTCVFVDSGQALSNTHAVSGAAADVDSNGSVDLLFVRYDFPNRIWLNNGSGFMSKTARYIGDYGVQAAFGHLDGDPDGPDVVIGSWGPNLVWHNDGNGNFSTTWPGLPSPAPNTMAVALGDLDGDEDLDLVLGNYYADLVWTNDGTGVFTDSGQSLDENTTDALALGDIDGDGDLDLVAADTQRSEVWKNNGAGVFSRSGYLYPSGPHGSSDAALGDVDGDGDLDLVLAVNGDEPNRLFLNDGTGTFTDSGQDLGVAWTAAVALGDVDGDGDLDAVFGNETSSTRVLFNDGAGIFTDSGMALGDPDGQTRDVVLADLDGDGDLDLVQGNYEGSSRIFFNRTTDGPPTGKLYFKIIGDNQLWSSDGISAAKATSINGSVNSQFRPLVIGYDLYFLAYDSVALDTVPWRLPEGGLPAEKLDLSFTDKVMEFIPYRDSLWISAQAGSYWGLRQHNGLSWERINTSISCCSDHPRNMFRYNDSFYFIFNYEGDTDLWYHFDYSGGPAIWVTENLNLNPSGNWETSSTDDMVEFNGLLYMSASDGVRGYELWKSNLSASGTTLFFDGNPGSDSSWPHPVICEDKLFFSLSNGTLPELWSYDGFNPPSQITLPPQLSSLGDELVLYDGKLFFSGQTPTDTWPFFEHHLWYYDSVSATFGSIHTNPTADSLPQYMTVYQNKLYFKAADESGSGLWVYDNSIGTYNRVAGSPAPNSYILVHTPLIPD